MRFPAIPLDKLIHALGGANVSLAVGFTTLLWMLCFQQCGTLTTPEITAAALIGTAAGSGMNWLKEKYDARHPATHTADKWDFYAGTLGSAAAGVVVFAAGVWII